MSDKAIEVIQEALADHMEYGFADRAAMAILAALKAAGIELVELPKARSRWDGEPKAWPVVDDSYVEVRKTDGHIGQVMVSNPIRDLSEVRHLAAALLAAANAAEAVEE